MANSITDTGFTPYAGQEVKGGASTTPYNQPVIALGDPFSAAALANLAKINGLLPKVARTIIHETRVIKDPLARVFNTVEDPLGVATEHAAFSAGATNKLNDGVCVARGSVDMVSQLTASNFAWDIPLSIYDREIAGAAMDNATVESYVAQKMRTIDKTIADLSYQAEKVIISDVVPGKRTITSTTASDGNGSAVSFTTTPAGYAGAVDKMSEWYISDVTAKSKVTITDKAASNASDMSVVLEMLQQLKDVAADFESSEITTYNKLGIKTHSTETPYLIMEKKVLNALDNVVANTTTSNGYGYSGFPTKTAREYIAGFADLVEIDAFAALPTYDKTTYANSVDYTGHRLGAVMLDKEAAWRIRKFSNVEGERCSHQRMYGYSARGEEDLAIWHGVPSYAMIVKNA